MEQRQPQGAAKERRRGALFAVAALALLLGVAIGWQVSPASGPQAGDAAAPASSPPLAASRALPAEEPAADEPPPRDAPRRDETYTLVGRVLQYESEKPVAGARVSVSPDGGDAGAALAATTDGAGVFRVPGLAMGLYRVGASANGWRAEEQPCFVPSPAEEISCEVTVFTAPTIEGRVVDERGAPVEGAEVVASPIGEEDDEGPRLLRPKPHSAQSDADGRFSLTAEIGFFVLTAHKGALSARHPDRLTLLEDNRVAGVVLKLRAQAAIVGRAISARTGEPLPGVSVAVADNEGHESVLAQVVARAVTGPDGRYAAGGLTAGLYAVTASAEGMTPVTREGVGLVAGARFTLDFEMTGAGGVEGFVRDGARRGVAGVRLLLAASGGSEHPATSGPDGHYLLERLPAGEATLVASSVASRFHASASLAVVPDQLTRVDLQAAPLASLHGRVLEADGEPSREPVVVHTSPDSMRDQRWAAEAARDGSYRLEAPPGPTLWVVAVAGDEKAGRDVRAYVTDLAPGESRKLDLKLPAKRSGEAQLLASGTVLEPGGEPSGSAELTARYERSADKHFSFSEEDGRFVFESLDDALAPGTLVIEAQNKGRVGRVRGVPAGSRNVVVRLEAGALLSGRVLSKAPVDKLKVLVQGLGGSPASVAAEFSGGAFELEELPPGRARVAVTTSTAAAGDAIVELAAGETTPVEITLREVGQASGRAVDSSSRGPMPGCTVLLRPQGGEAVVATTETAPDGRFRFEALGAGSYSALVECDAADAYGARAFSLDPGQSLDVGEIALTPPAPGRIGIQFGGDSLPLVALVEPGAPAERAGVLAGDLIVSADGTPVYSVTEAMLRIRGEAGTTVRIAVQRDDRELRFELVREKLPEP